MSKISQLTAKIFPYSVSLRRHFRMHPETGGREEATQERIMSELKDMGLEPKAAGGTGVVAVLDGGRPGRTVAVRADIDALPVNDEIDKPYKSTVPGVSHACGHDAHTAIALGVAKLFTEIKDELGGNIRFIFQPKEELIPGGAEGMIADGVLGGADAIVGAHVWQPIEVGKIGIAIGPVMAAPDEFAITIKGRGGHGSMPHQAIDPIAVGAHIVLALKAITGSAVDPREPAALSVGLFKAGEVFNIIPETAAIVGTVRTFGEEARSKIHQQIDQICRGHCLAAGAGYSLEIKKGHPPVVNHPEISVLVEEAGREVLGMAGVEDFRPVLVAEDFSYYLEKVPGAFFFIGAGNTEKGIVFPHHHPKFDIDEACLKNGIEIMAGAALKILNNHKY